MFGWLSKLARSSGSATPVRAAAAEMEVEASGRLPLGVAEGGRAPEPSPEYINEAGTPSENAWAREQERYHRKQEHRDTGS